MTFCFLPFSRVMVCILPILPPVRALVDSSEVAKASANASESSLEDSFAVSSEAEASEDADPSCASSCARCNSSLICFFSCSVDIASAAALSITEPPSREASSSVRLSLKMMRNPLVRNAISLSLLFNTSKSYTVVSVKIVSSGRKVTFVPVFSTGQVPISFKE